MSPSLRADRYAILSATSTCHACDRMVPVSKLLVPEFYEFDGDQWQRERSSALLTYIEAMDTLTLTTWCAKAPSIRFVPSVTAGFSYWGNVCTCGALLGEYFLTKPEAAFFPLTEEAISQIGVEWVEAPLEAEATTSESTWIDLLIERFPYAGWQPAPNPRSRRARARP